MADEQVKTTDARKPAQEIWETLSRIDVSEHTEQKMSLTYLSWAWAWGTLMEHYPEAQYRFTHFDGLDVMTYPDQSCAVHCVLEIRGVTRTMWLPVMDHRNNAIPNPSSRQISDTKMRALVKAIAMFGLGHYIYAGEDLPAVNLRPASVPTEPKVEAPAETKAEPEVKKDETPEVQTNDGVVTTLEVFIADSKSVESLMELFKANKETLDEMKGSNPQRRARIIEHFNKKNAELTTSEAS